MTSIASPTARNRPARMARRSSGSRVAASAKSRVKTISGSIAASTAARIGLVGTRPTTKPPSVGRSGTAAGIDDCPWARRAAPASAGIDRRANSGGPASAANRAAPARSTRNHVIVRAPSRPSDRTSAKLVTLVKSSDTTSGTSTIRIAFTHSAPSGSTRPASASSGANRAADTPIPAPRPTTSAARPSTAGRSSAARCVTTKHGAL